MLTLFVFLVSSVHIAIDSSVSAVPGSVFDDRFPLSKSTFRWRYIRQPCGVQKWATL